MKVAFEIECPEGREDLYERHALWCKISWVVPLPNFRVIIFGRAFSPARATEEIKMMTIRSKRAVRVSALALAVAFLLAPLAATAQTRIVAPRNKYSPSDDVKLGQQAARQVYQQMPMLRDAAVKEYVASVGQRQIGRAQSEL